MSGLDQLARDVEQVEASTEALVGIIMIMWRGLKEMSPDHKVAIINKWIETTMKPPSPTIPGNFTNNST